METELLDGVYIEYVKDNKFEGSSMKAVKRELDAVFKRYSLPRIGEPWSPPGGTS